jgi:ATP-dependent DNA ligase
MDYVLDCLEELASTPKKKEKVSLLKEFLEDDTFREVLKRALNPNTKYKIKKLPTPKNNSKTTAQELFDFLDCIAKAKGVSKEEKQELADLSFYWGKAGIEVVTRICNKDLKCGCGDKLVNEAEAGFIKTYPYMRYQKEGKLEQLIPPLRVEEKIDSDFINIAVTPTDIKMFTRNGSPVYVSKDSLLDEIEDLADLAPFDSVVFHGEIQILQENGERLPRKKSSGIVNKIIKQTASQKEHDRVHLFLWDAIPTKNFWEGIYEVPLRTRTSWLLEHIPKCKHLSFPEHNVCSSVDDVRKKAKYYISLGKEGVVAKSLEGIWKDSSSGVAWGVKIKSEKDADLEIIEVYRGEKGSKYEGCLGGFLCRSSCEELHVKVGSGMDDSMRGYLGNEKGKHTYDTEYVASLEDRFVGKIVELKFNEVSKDEKGNNSLYLPIFVAIREDKSEAETFARIKEK